MKRQKLTADILRSLLTYDPESGLFHWLKSRQGVSKSANLRAGRTKPNAQGYDMICVNYELHLSHRLAWLYVHGRWPKHQIDHINGDRMDNRLCNLREATQSENNANARLHKHNTSGYKGVFFSSQVGKWLANIEWKGKKYHVGTFDTAEAAAEARHRRAREIYGEFFRER